MNPFDHAEFSAHEQVIFCSAGDLRAIIAIHSTALGPAAGGVRMWPYPTFDDALTDALRLSRAMSYKNALAGLPLGGGKSVIVGDALADKTPELLASFAAYVQSLAGRYWCAEDVGMGLEDVTVLAETCDFVFGLPDQVGDPSPHTAKGVFEGLRGAVDHALGSFGPGLRVAVQGVGNVGYHLCEELAEARAELVVTDIHEEPVQRAVDELGATAVGIDDIYDADVDVFAPCALGGVINDSTIERLRAAVVAGAANNQLATPEHGRALHGRGITYAPDFLVNAGGMLSVGGRVFGDNDPEKIPGRLAALYDKTRDLLARADAEEVAPSDMALLLAKERIAAGSAS